MADERLAMIAEPGEGASGTTTILGDVAEYIRGVVTRRGFLQTTGLGAVAFYVVGCGSNKQDLQPRKHCACPLKRAALRRARQGGQHVAVQSG